MPSTLIDIIKLEKWSWERQPDKLGIRNGFLFLPVRTKNFISVTENEEVIDANRDARDLVSDEKLPWLVKGFRANGGSGVKIIVSHQKSRRNFQRLYLLVNSLLKIFNMKEALF